MLKYLKIGMGYKDGYCAYMLGIHYEQTGNIRLAQMYYIDAESLGYTDAKRKIDNYKYKSEYNNKTNDETCMTINTKNICLCGLL